jgi:D-glycero-alpha-D-manno-heptose-7-phosphate kinase
LIIRAKAPLRISFAVGGTDVSPYPEDNGGCVLSCAIDRYSYCTLVLHDRNTINIRPLTIMCLLVTPLWRKSIRWHSGYY